MSQEASPGVSAADFFTQRIAGFRAEYEKNLQRFNWIANLRLVLVTLTVGGTWYFYSQSLYSVCTGLLIISGAIFSGLVILHTKSAYLKIKAETLLNISQRSLRRSTGEWAEMSEAKLPAVGKSARHTPDKYQGDGADFRDTNHRYTADLDIFGEHSLYQFLNCTSTFYGQKKLAERLSSPIISLQTSATELRARQIAIQELAKKIIWCQEFESEGRIAQACSKDPAALIAWAQGETSSFAQRAFYKKLIHFLPLLTLILIPVTIAFKLPYQILFGSVCGHLLMMAYNYLVLNRFFIPISDNQKELQSFFNLLRSVEQTHFDSPYLTEIQKALGTGSDSAARKISRLTFIMDMTDIRFNPLMHFVLNFLFIWDYHCYAALENWKSQSGNKIDLWLQSIATFEELTSFASLAFSVADFIAPTERSSHAPHLAHQAWTYPIILDDDGGGIDRDEHSPRIEAQELGHPLIHPKNRVANSFKMGPDGKIFIITGSNMSGKSTFLRTIGINLVLAYTGAPVCARELRCSVMNLSTSMRTHDNLENHVSSFYAEVLRIKTIIDAAATQSENMLFLVDEIFKGTNSHDRQFGAEMIIRNLHRPNILGLVSTHDLILGELAQDQKLSVKNFHFCENYHNDQIQFDYKLCPGVSTTTNGLYLLKMVGIS